MTSNDDIASVLARIAEDVGGLGGLGPYSASKHAVAAFNLALRAELARNTKMSSSVIEPGEIKTAIWDKAMQRVDDLEERMVDGDMRARYGFLLDGNRGFIKEGMSPAI